MSESTQLTDKEIEDLIEQYKEIAERHGFSLTPEIGLQFVCRLERGDFPYILEFYPDYDQGEPYFAISLDLSESKSILPKWDALVQKVLYLDNLHTHLKNKFASFDDSDIGVVTLFYNIPAQDPTDTTQLEEFIKFIGDYVEGEKK